MKPVGYRVIFQGIQPDREMQAVRQALADEFRATPEKIDVLLARLPVVQKENVDQATALKYRNAVLKAGGDCRIELMERSGGDPDAPLESGSPLRICPRCGYEAVAPQDPLLTAYGGQGECPSCGIILSKFNREASRPPEGELKERGPDRATITSHGGGRRFPAQMVFIGLVLVAVLAYYFMAKNDSNRQEVNTNGPPSDRQPVVQGQEQENRSGAGAAVDPSRITAADLLAEQERAKWVQPTFRVAPGETKIFTISLYLPCLHDSAAIADDLKPLYNLQSNTWNERGVEAEVRRATVTNHSAGLWEIYQKGQNTWRPVRADKNMRITSMRRDREIKGPELFQCSNISALRKIINLSREEIDAVAKRTEGGSLELRQTSYRFYRADFEISIRLPDGYEFRTHELKKGDEETGQKVRRGKLQLQLLGLEVVKATVLSLSRPAYFDMEQENGKEGILVALSKSTPDWEVRE